MKAYISDMACDGLKNYLEKLGYETVPVFAPNVYPEISRHPDICMCHTGTDLFMGDPEKPGFSYPDDICYNAACTGRYFIHNLRYTDKKLIEHVRKAGITAVHVKQGYTKCNTVVVDETSIITSDMGIYRACSPLMDVLLISPGQVLLPGMSCGFLGGASGRAGKRILFNGDLSAHSDFGKIKKFIEERGLEPVWFRSVPLTDIGSIICDDTTHITGKTRREK